MICIECPAFITQRGRKRHDNEQHLAQGNNKMKKNLLARIELNVAAIRIPAEVLISYHEHKT
jgi:hypothetical protein